MKAAGCIPREMHAHEHACVHALKALISHLLLRGLGSPEACCARDSQMEVPMDREGRLAFHNAGHEEKWDLKQLSLLVDHLGAGAFPNFGCPSPSGLKLPLRLPELTAAPVLSALRTARGFLTSFFLSRFQLPFSPPS